MAAPVTSDHLPPSTASYVFATAIIAGVIGYFAGQGASLGLFSSTPTRSKRSTPKGANNRKADDEDDEESDFEDEDDDETEDDAAPLATFDGNRDEVKLVLVVRTDLGMGKGK